MQLYKGWLFIKYNYSYLTRGSIIPNGANCVYKELP